MTPEEYQQQFDILEAATKDTHARLWHEAPVAEQRVICPLCHAERAHGYCLCAAQRKPGEGGFTWDRNNPSGPTEKFLQNHAQWPHTLCRDETCKFCTSKVGDVCECCEEEGDGGGDDLEVASPVPLVIPDKVWVDGTIVPSDDASPAAAQWPEPPFAVRWGGGICWVLEDGSDVLFRAVALVGRYRTTEVSLKKDDCTLYTPQPGDMIPLWPVWRKQSNTPEHAIPWQNSAQGVIDFLGTLHCEDDASHFSLALDQSPHWVRKE